MKRRGSIIDFVYIIPKGLYILYNFLLFFLFYLMATNIFKILKLAEVIISKNLNSDGFTEVIIWKKARYIVAFTNNIIRTSSDIDKVFAQIKENSSRSSLTIGGWRDTATSLFYLDLGIATDNLEEALSLAKEYGQIAIFDLVDFNEIRV